MVIKKRCILAVLWLSTFSLYGHATATATIDRNEIAIDETFALKLTLDETSFFDKPDVSELENNFTVLGSQKSSQTSYINGNKTAVTEWSYQLAPKHEGILSIPAIDIDGEKTQALSLKVTPRKKYSGSNTEPVFMEAVTDKNSVYVQEQLLLTIRINTSLNLHNLQLANLEVENAFVKEVSNTQYEHTLNNTRYITYEIVYAIFPQSSGELSIPSLAASGVNPGARQYNSFFGGGQNIRLQSEALTIPVKEIPPQIGGNLWLPAKGLILKETWSADPDNINVGDSITRTITTTATGLSGEQLPPITMQADAHYKVYADQPALSDSKNNSGIVGERKDAITLVATEPGDITLPEISVQWWDIASNSLKTEVLPPVTIKIKGTANIRQENNTTNTPTTSTEAPASNMPVITDLPSGNIDNSFNTNVLVWQISTAISTVLALLFFILFLRARKQRFHITPVVDPIKTAGNNALKTLKTACQSMNIPTIRLALLEWAKEEWPQSTIHSTSDICRLANDEKVDMWIKKIDAHLYNKKSTQENWLELYALIAAKASYKASGTDNALAPLYPR